MLAAIRGEPYRGTHRTVAETAPAPEPDWTGAFIAVLIALFLVVGIPFLFVQAVYRLPPTRGQAPPPRPPRLTAAERKHVILIVTAINLVLIAALAVLQRRSGFLSKWGAEPFGFKLLSSILTLLVTELAAVKASEPASVRARQQTRTFSSQGIRRTWESPDHSSSSWSSSSSSSHSSVSSSFTGGGGSGGGGGASGSW